MELISFQCKTNLNQKFPEAHMQGFYFYLPKEVSCAQILQVKNDCAVQEHLHVYTVFPYERRQNADIF
jgi:hypothetical protein